MRLGELVNKFDELQYGSVDDPEVIVLVGDVRLSIRKVVAKADSVLLETMEYTPPRRDNRE